MKKDRFYINESSEIRAFCLNSDKEDVYMYIYSLQQENQSLKDRIEKAIEILECSENMFGQRALKILKEIKNER